ncbi:aminopeptidase P family protein [Altericista sp. CCNU0014]|uniref:aminopeptidase P family protein n=1 Tax=Altericista sp. CCNU0014 TaxID=3082949 RepID=UPI00384B9D66
MLLNSYTTELVATLAQRRQKLGDRLNRPVLLWSGSAPPRNFPANRHPFRASSHFLYFAGVPLQEAVIHLHCGQLTLFVEDATPADALWHGPSPQRSDIANCLGAAAAYPLAELHQFARDAVTIPVQNPTARQHQSQVLGRPLDEANALEGGDLELAEVLVELRLVQDNWAIAAMQQAADVTVKAHLAGMARTRQAKTEAEVRAAMEMEMMAAQMEPAYQSIVTTRGEILHSQTYHRVLNAGDLLLVDVGAEHPLGWAADVTRTWPVSGQWSATQRAIYEIVLAARDVCIAAVRPGVEYRDIHLMAAKTIAEGLVDVGILRGSTATLVERAAHALFFPHGIGHLLGLDVHDMEDLGDLAGYAPGRVRSREYGMQYLRLNRPLQAGTVVTIEPGFYQVPGILDDRECRDAFADCVNWERLADFEDVRGIRIEDDVLVTEAGCRVLTAALPTRADEVAERLRV